MTDREMMSLQEEYFNKKLKSEMLNLHGKVDILSSIFGDTDDIDGPLLEEISKKISEITYIKGQRDSVKSLLK